MRWKICWLAPLLALNNKMVTNPPGTTVFTGVFIYWALRFARRNANKTGKERQSDQGAAGGGDAFHFTGGGGCVILVLTTQRRLRL